MKCSDMLMRLLEAEREELEGVGDSRVAIHVRDCASCQTVARRLLAGTSLLVSDMKTRDSATRIGLRARSSRSRVVTRSALWTGALAAAAAVVLFFPPARRSTASHNATVSTVARVAPTPSAAEEPRTSSRPKSPPVPTLDGLVPVPATRFPDPVAATAAQFVASQLTEQRMAWPESSGVSAAPPMGTRAVVLATRDPKITIVWLY